MTKHFTWLALAAQLIPMSSFPAQAFEFYGRDMKLIPLPIYSTVPNEGSTYGFMPVFMVVEEKTQHTDAIIAPSVSWNRIIRFTHTFRLYYYPGEDENLNFIPSISSNINRNLTLEYFKRPRAQGLMTKETSFHARRSVFYRYFGLGPQTKADEETSYTRVGGDLTGRLGYNLTSSFNVGARVSLYRDLVERKRVDFLPLTTDVFPRDPGMGGATTLLEALSLRFDTRPDREYSVTGVDAELLAGVNQGLAGTDAFGRIQLETRVLWEEFSFLNGAARGFWSYMPGSNIPFYDQSSLGGSFRLRGFTEDRYIDKGAWELELEQRFVLFSTHIYGVVADWRIDPFVAVGQVYHDAADMFHYAKVSGGLGFRAYVRPNVLGRVDTAVGGEGIKVYVELGLPF
ncbi:MAG: BamA/TamA family outer membrane protein [Deltaproteobacteria bacterium]|nr:BamA/TamA family outer membrane protein [Deltaproteobacteria bacterium]